MPRDEVTIQENVMKKIESGEVKMRSKLYFVFGALAMLLGVVGSMILAAFFVSLTSFALRTHGPMGSYRLQEILASFPWWAPILAFLGLVVGIWLLRKYDLSYKRNFILVVILLLIAIVLTGVAIDYLGLNDVWMKRGPMRQYWEQMGDRPGRYGQGQGSGQGQGNGLQNNQ